MTDIVLCVVSHEDFYFLINNVKCMSDEQLKGTVCHKAAYCVGLLDRPSAAVVKLSHVNL